MSDYDGEWYPNEGGQTIATRGPEGGYILRDEELGDPEEPEDADARLILEQGYGDDTGFRVVANLYGGWLYLALPQAERADAEALYETLRDDLVRLAAMIPMEDDRDIDGRVAALMEAIATVERRFETMGRD